MAGRKGSRDLWDNEVSRVVQKTKMLNDKLANDSKRSFVVQINVGDGYTIAVKK